MHYELYFQNEIIKWNNKAEDQKYRTNSMLSNQDLSNVLAFLIKDILINFDFRQAIQFNLYFVSYNIMSCYWNTCQTSNISMKNIFDKLSTISWHDDHDRKFYQKQTPILCLNALCHNLRDLLCIFCIMIIHNFDFASRYNRNNIIDFDLFFNFLEFVHLTIH